MRFQNILESIGKTPNVRLGRLFQSSEVWLKLERNNPGGSIKDRIAIGMIEDAEQRGVLKPDTLIIEPTSGNTGIGLAMVAAVKGYQLLLVMPESMSIERRRLMAAYGAKFDLTPRDLGMKGAIERARQLAGLHPNSWIPQQFDNPANVAAHERSTAEEIAADFPEGIDYLITGVGTGGHITACARVLKNKFPNLLVFAVEPELSPVLSGGAPGPHPIQGIGAGFVPANCETSRLDGVIQVSRDEAWHFTKRIVAEEGIFCGISTGATLAAIHQKLPEIPEHATVLGFNYDTGERYLSVEGLFE
jgi:cysteine synthase A